MKIHEARFCRDLRWCQTSQHGLLEHAGHFAAGAEKDIEHGMRAIRMFYQIGNHMRKIVDRHAAQPFFLQQSYGLAKIGSAIFQIGNGAADRGDDALQQSRDAFTGPGIGHRDSDTAHML